MNAIATIAKRLVLDKGFPPVDPLSVPDGVTAPHGVDFVAVLPYWGSLMSIGLISGDDIGDDVGELSRRTESVYQFTRSLLPLTGSIQHGFSSTKLASFGLLCYISERGCSPQVVKNVQAEKRGSAWRKDYMLCWALDVPAAEVHRHKWLPMAMFPGRAYLKGLLDQLAENRVTGG